MIRRRFKSERCKHICGFWIDAQSMCLIEGKTQLCTCYVSLLKCLQKKKPFCSFRFACMCVTITNCRRQSNCACYRFPFKVAVTSLISVCAKVLLKVYISFKKKKQFSQQVSTIVTINLTPKRINVNDDSQNNWCTKGKKSLLLCSAMLLLFAYVWIECRIQNKTCTNRWLRIQQSHIKYDINTPDCDEKIIFYSFFSVACSYHLLYCFFFVIYNFNIYIYTHFFLYVYNNNKFYVTYSSLFIIPAAYWME